MSRLKVLIPVDHAVGISGPHRNVVGSLNALGARDDVEVVLLTSMIDRSEPYASALNIDVRLGFQPHDLKRMPVNLWRIQVAARGCDVIYVPSGLKAFLYAQCVRLGRRLVAGPNVTPLPIGKRPDSPGRLELHYLSDAWFEMSRYRRDHVRSQSGVQAVSYIHHAIDLEKFSPAHRCADVWKDHGVPEKAIKVVYVGRDNEARKGVTQLLDAAERVSRIPGQDVHFIFVGTMSSETQNRAAAMDNVSLLGFMVGASLPRIVASADVAVIPSSWESFGFTILESMASGLPVISTRSGAIPELIEHEQSGILLDLAEGGKRHKNNAGEQIAEAVLELVKNPAKRRQLGRNARERAERCFSEERLGSDLMAVFRGDLLPAMTSSGNSG